MKKSNVRNHTMKLRLNLLIILAVLGLTAACNQTPQTTPPELTELVERAAIEDFFNDYYAQFGPESKHDFMSYFADDGRLEVNGLIAKGLDEIKAMYTMTGSGGQENVPLPEEGPVPQGISRMMFTNLKIDLQEDKAIATMLWHSIKSDLLTSPPKVTEYGTERTELIKKEGHWLISKRVILSEGGMPEGLMDSYPKN